MSVIDRGNNSIGFYHLAATGLPDRNGNLPPAFMLELLLLMWAHSFRDVASAMRGRRRVGVAVQDTEE